MRATIRYPAGGYGPKAEGDLDGACAPLDLTRKASPLPAEVRRCGWLVCIGSSADPSTAGTNQRGGRGSIARAQVVTVHVMVGDGWSLADGEALHTAAPRGFFIPDREQRERLATGRIVKLVFLLDHARVVDGTPRTGERMWVQVTEVLPGGRYAGTLDNDPGIVSDLTCGDRIEFGPEHVVAIHYSEGEHGYAMNGWAYVDGRVRRDDQPPDFFVFDSPAPGSVPMWFGAIGADAPDATMTLAELTDRWPQLSEVFRSPGGLWQRVKGAAEWREVRPPGSGS